VLAEIGSVVHMPGCFVTAMYVHVASEFVVKVNRAAQDHRGVRHGPDCRRRLRHRNHCTLLHERRYRQQHETAGDPL
jgi:hypothetical protein